MLGNFGNHYFACAYVAAVFPQKERSGTLCNVQRPYNQKVPAIHFVQRAFVDAVAKLFKEAGCRLYQQLYIIKGEYHAKVETAVSGNRYNQLSQLLSK